MCYCDSNDGPTVDWESHPIAKKTHNCCECGSRIDPGEKYWLYKGIWGGEFLTFKTCEICENIRNEAMLDGFECIAFECLYETVGSEYEYAAV